MRATKKFGVSYCKSKRVGQNFLKDIGHAHSMMEKRDTTQHEGNAWLYPGSYKYYDTTQKEHGLQSGLFITLPNES